MHYSTVANQISRKFFDSHTHSWAPIKAGNGPNFFNHDVKNEPQTGLRVSCRFTNFVCS